MTLSNCSFTKASGFSQDTLSDKNITFTPQVRIRVGFEEDYTPFQETDWHKSMHNYALTSFVHFVYVRQFFVVFELSPYYTNVWLPTERLGWIGREGSTTCERQADASQSS